MEKIIWDWVAVQRRCGFLIPDENVTDLINALKADAEQTMPFTTNSGLKGTARLNRATE